MLLTISGPPGSGKSTVAAAVGHAFDYDHVSGGDIFRSLAEERGLSLAAFNALAEEDDAIDRDLDRRLRSTARDRDDVVLESRLSGWMAGEYADLKVWLDAPLDVRAARIADREEKSVDAARAETEEREASERSRYLEYYDIDFADRSIYDLAVNTARWTPNATVDLLVSAVEAYDPAADEGAAPVDARYEF
ncbi:MAG: AAA family ATPase [Halobacteriales archaeon]|nr:AAA family ATPase [Halobacteriales archaeon]